MLRGEDAISLPTRNLRCTRALALIFILLVVSVAAASAQSTAQKSSPPASCQIAAVDFKGWHAQQLSNTWLKLLFIPQNGGRLIQVVFGGHSYLFNNPEYEGKYLPPSQEKWFNYGGDKVWLLPEGDEDEQHWRGNSDTLDDGEYSFQTKTIGQRCQIELTSPADAHTGIQFVRTISLEGDSPRIQFHTLVKNITGHSIEWSVQSVSQYDTADPIQPAQLNHDFWVFTPANPTSSYLNRYHARTGPGEGLTASVREDGLFAMRYAYLGRELWLDSHDGWLAVVDSTSKYAMVERFHYDDSKPYPGKASVIFYTSGVELHLDENGMAALPSGEHRKTIFYLEAELNSPLVQLRPGENFSFDTEWYPTRAGSEFHGVTESGVIINPLRARYLENGNLHLSGSFGIFFAGKLVAHLYDRRGQELPSIPISNVEPTDLITLSNDIPAAGKPARVSLHLEDKSGLDRGPLGEVLIEPAPEKP